MAATGTSAVDRARPPLDDVMLAMDVVDTLRRRDRLVARELDEQGREDDLKQRLKRIYAQQGINVPEHVLEQGVAALREDRFTYAPLKPGVTRWLALAYVRRGRWGKWLAGGTAAALLAGAVNYFAFVAPDRALPGELEQRQQAVMALAATDDARTRVSEAYQAGLSALASDDAAAARRAIERLDGLQNTLRQAYVIRILNEPGQQSGVWRIPDVNQQARNYYVIVEAIGAGGERLAVNVLNEETGSAETVTRWGLRVDAATFEAVKRDKLDDGIIENDRFGRKQRGYLLPDYEMPTSGGAITRW